MAAESAFGRVSAVRALGEGRYACQLAPEWSTLAGINGGMLTAILINAMHAEAGADRQVRSLTVHFLRPPKAGDAQIAVEVLRSGQRSSTVRLRLEQDGRHILEALGTVFVGGLRVVGTWSPEPPQVEGPATADADMTLEGDPRRPAVADHIRYTPRIGPRPLSGTPLAPGEPARTGGWLELKDPHPITSAVLALFTDMWWPAALGPISEMSFNPTIEFTFHQRTMLPPEGLPPQPLLLDVTTQASLEGLVDEDTRLFTADGTLLAQSRQLAITMTPADRTPVTKDAPLR